MFFSYSASGPAVRCVIYFGSILVSLSLHLASCRRPFSNILGSKMHAVISIKFQCDLCPVFVPLGRLWASHWHSQGRQHGSKMDPISPSIASLMPIPSKSTRDPPQDHPRASQNTPQTLILATILTLFWWFLGNVWTTFLQHAYNIPTTSPRHSCCIRFYLFRLSTLLAAFAQQAKSGPHKRGRRSFARRASSIMCTSA